MLKTAIAIGQQAEDAACLYLNNQGLTTLYRNFRGPRGEIDAIMQDRDTIVFIEVRYRKQSRFGSGAESVNHTKQAKLLATALYFLQKHPTYNNYPSRFDVISISGEVQGNGINWIRDAFQS